MIFAVAHAAFRPMAAGLAAAVLCLAGLGGAARAQERTEVVGESGGGSVTVDLSVLEGPSGAPSRGSLLFPGSGVEPGERIVLSPPGSPAARERAQGQAPDVREQAGRPTLTPPRRSVRRDENDTESAPSAAPRERTASTPPPVTEPQPAPSAPPAPTKAPTPPPTPARTADTAEAKSAPEPRAPEPAKTEPEPSPTPAAEERATKPVPADTAPSKAEKTPAPPPPASARMTPPPPPPPPPRAAPRAAPVPRAEVSPAPAEREPPSSAEGDRPARQTAALPESAAAVPGSHNRILFSPGSAQLESDARAVLDRVVTALAGDPALRVQLTAYARGGTDSVSQARRLSLSRALAVRSHLIKGGVGATRIDVRALGDKVQDGPPNRVDVSVVTR